MAAARILLLGDDAAQWTSGSWWGLSTCCVRDAAVQPEPPHPGGSGWLDWLLQSESGPVGETWVKKISFHQLPETLHLFSRVKTRPCRGSITSQIPDRLCQHEECLGKKHV